MALPAQFASQSPAGSTRIAAFAPVSAGAALIVTPDALIGDALAMAISACGVAARVANHLPLRRSEPSDPRGAALVVLSDTTVTPERAVLSLVADGRRVALLADPRDDGIAACLEVGAEAIVPPSSDLNSLVAVVHGLSRDGPVESPVDPTRLRPRRQVVASVRRAEADLLAGLTPREADILMRLSAGDRAAVIARSGFVSLHTVRTQIRSILRKLDVHSQLEAVAMANRSGWAAGRRRR